MKTLTFLQKRFIKEYAECGNGSQAARRAGYSPSAARQQAYENLRKPHVRDALTVQSALTHGAIDELVLVKLKELLEVDNPRIRYQALKIYMKMKSIT